ncbi:hypothetical protein ElyMa_002989200 [Elysia marginata]|uniref:Uncharacterized protein n=1 Tax=Elysia marginata TaxID=1093978 RepID=A0AAV4IAG3_9GAST|nr:hypothetical protein ElyMa_002989200 [Elysia marginata]
MMVETVITVDHAQVIGVSLHLAKSRLSQGHIRPCHQRAPFLYLIVEITTSKRSACRVCSGCQAAIFRSSHLTKWFRTRAPAASIVSIAGQDGTGGDCPDS